MKAWGWISIRRSLEDAMNKAFEETTMKNVPIDQFWSFKRRNGAQNWNLRKKLSKIGHVENFDFWLKVNAKKSKSKSTGPESKSTNTGLGRVTGRAVDPLTSSYDVSLTWTCLRGCWHGVVTSSYDVRWHQQQYRRVVGACNVHRHVDGTCE